MHKKGFCKLPEWPPKKMEEQFDASIVVYGIVILLYVVLAVLLGVVMYQR